MWRAPILGLLKHYTKIPNKSPIFDPDWKENGYMDDAVRLLTDSIRSFDIQGLRYDVLEVDGRTPLIFIEVETFKSGPGNVLLYGHFDKQPEFTGWHEGKGPWTPVLENGRLYGRGTGDDGYALFSCLSALSGLQAQGCAHPRCTIVIEGCEESGSPDLPFYMQVLSPRIGTPDVVVCLDAECGNYDQLWLTTSLRGMVSGTLRVEVLTEGVHSGAAGGIVPSSFRVLRGVLERIENSSDGNLAHSLHVPIPDWVTAQSNDVANTLRDTIVERYPWAGKKQYDQTDLSKMVTSNTWLPCFEVVGLGGAPKPILAGNTLRPNTDAKLVFRLPPAADHAKVQSFLKKELERDPPSGAKVTFNCDAAESGWFSKPVQTWLDHALNEASKFYFGQPYKRMGTGGTIPFMRMLGDQFPACQFVVTGVLGPHSNAHGPNEFLDLATAEKVTCCVAQVLCCMGRGDHLN